MPSSIIDDKSISGMILTRYMYEYAMSFCFFLSLDVMSHSAQGSYKTHYSFLDSHSFMGKVSRTSPYKYLRYFAVQVIGIGHKLICAISRISHIRFTYTYDCDLRNFPVYIKFFYYYMLFGFEVSG